PALERWRGLHVDFPRDADYRRLPIGGCVRDRESPALVHIRKPILPAEGEAETQLRDGSSGIRASSAYCPPLRTSTSDHSEPGSSRKTSSGTAASTIQSSRSSSPSSWPGPQPA